MAYTPTVWETGDVITAEKLNKAEQGIAAAIPFVDCSEITPYENSVYITEDSDVLAYPVPSDVMASDCAISLTTVLGTSMMFESFTFVTTVEPSDINNERYLFPTGTPVRVFSGLNIAIYDEAVSPIHGTKTLG